MRKNLLLFFALVFTTLSSVQAQDQIYVNNEEFTEGYFVNPTTTTYTPILLDDINVPYSYFGSSDSLAVSKITIRISRTEQAEPVTIKFYYSLVNPAASDYSETCAFPPIEIGSAELDTTIKGQFGSTPVTIGDGTTPLFTMQKNNNVLLPDYHTFFLGVSVSKPIKRRYVGPLLLWSRGSGWELSTASQSAFFDSAWLYEPESGIGGNQTLFFSEGVIFPQIYTAEVYGNAFGTLPINLKSFTGTLKNNNVLLNWTTATENNNKGFYIERSTDGRAYVSIGFVPGAGNSTQQQQYSFTDLNISNLKANTTYYRLKQVDLDGKINYSGVVPINLENILRWNIYPNPVTNAGWLQLQLTKAENVNIQVISREGKIVQSINKGLMPEGSSVVPVDFSRMAKGTYFVKVFVGDNVFTKTIVK